MATTPRNFRQLEGSELRPSPNARVLGPADETETLRATIVLRRRPDGPPVPGPAYYLRTPPSERPDCPGRNSPPATAPTQRT
jgi:hypothetical protein